FAGGAATAMVLNLEPIFVIFLAAAFLGEDLTLPRVLGTALVIGAVVVSEVTRGRRDVVIEPVG
ncbi:MAG TPA: EamA family transporter, partial [Nordella sp.]|nr:EamA family transporter [Nordella sp.]